MRNHRSRRSRNCKFARKQHGQALLEGAAGTMLMVFVFVLLIMFSLNVYFALRYSADLKLVANEAFLR